MSTKKKYKLGLALSGGGARGFAHIGALYALEEMRIKPDIIAGVSAGSVVAALYGSGVAPLDILKLFYNRKFSDFCEIGIPKEGIFAMEGFKQFIRDGIKVTMLEDCPTPTVICATNIENSTPIQWREGEISERVAASCSIPIVFKPVRIDGADYVDGGVLHNLPAWAIHRECEFTLGINVSPVIRAKNYTGTLLDIAQRTYHTMARSNANADMSLCDLVISADSIADVKVFSINDKERAFKSGYKSTKTTITEYLQSVKNNPFQNATTKASYIPASAETILQYLRKLRT